MWNLAGKQCGSRLLMGTAGYPSLAYLTQAIQSAATSVVTISLKRQCPQAKGGQAFWDAIQKTGVLILPNTAGCRHAYEAVELAHMSREIFATDWIKLEVIGDSTLLQPHPFELVKAAEALVKLGFRVFPYCTEDTVLCQRLWEVGCQILMPWGAPIGSGKGLLNPFQLTLLRERFPQATLIIDAGIGSPEHALKAMLLGYDGVLVNSAIARAQDPVNMAHAFSLAVQSGRLAYRAGIMPQTDCAIASTPLAETLFWKNS